MTSTANVVVIGAGIAGVAAAHDLVVRRGLEEVVIVDPRPPLTLTSDKSTECYRNYWPAPSMVGLMNRSIDLFEEMSIESANAFGLNRQGYLFATGDRDRLADLETSATISSSYGAGPVRVHDRPGTFTHRADGFDVLATSAALLDSFPFISDRASGALYVQRAGWLSAQQLGTWMLDRIRAFGGILMADEVTDIEVVHGSVTAVGLRSGNRIVTPSIVNAAGPLAPAVARLAGVELPIFSELHLKVGFKDHLGIIPRDAPMFIWSDPQTIDWDAEERNALLEMGRGELVGEMPIFCHGRPEGGEASPYVLALWEYHDEVGDPVWPLPEDPLYPEVVIRGLATMVPGMRAYQDHIPESVIDGGYYSKTMENHPLVGPAGPDGFFLLCAMSGFGVMVSAGAAELLGAHVSGTALPEYAKDFCLSRYDDADYVARIRTSPGSGQL